MRWKKSRKLRLSLEEREVDVEGFSADLMARDSLDDSLVLIENQLEGSDHTHLGQIMTYLAGLDASTVIWIAREFHEAHLSAIRWLNSHTPDKYAFFRRASQGRPNFRFSRRPRI